MLGGSLLAYCVILLLLEEERDCAAAATNEAGAAHDPQTWRPTPGRDLAQR